MANLGLAYLVHYDLVPQLEKASDYFTKTLKRIETDKALTDLNFSAFLNNMAVLDLAEGKRPQATERLKLAREEAMRAKSPLVGQLTLAINFNEALRLSRGDVVAKREAFGKLENYLLSVSPRSQWWTVALEKYTALGKEIDREPISVEALTRRFGPERLRVVPSVTVQEKHFVTLSDETAAVLEKLNAPKVRGLPIFNKANVKRYNDVRPGVDILGGEQVLAIFLTSGAAPPIIIQGSGLGAGKEEIRVGMTAKAFGDALKGQFVERVPRAVDNPNFTFTFLPDLGLGVRFCDGLVSELLIAQIPEKMGP